MCIILYFRIYSKVMKEGLIFSTTKTRPVHSVEAITIFSQHQLSGGVTMLVHDMHWECRSPQTLQYAAPAEMTSPGC